MSTLHREVERKYALDDDAPLPDLAGVPGVASVGDPVVHRLEATYFDTADLALAAARTTLRRRTGGEDAGWHLKLPALDGARQEVRLPLDAGGGDADSGGDGDGAVPGELARLAWSAARGAALAPVVLLATERTVHHLLGPAGEVLAEVADDRVTATRLGAGADPEPQEGPQTDPQTWRELEVELVEADRPGAEALLDAVEEHLAGLGVSRSASASKLARALGTGRDQRTPQTAPPLTPGSPAGEVVLAHVRELVQELAGLDPHVRLDAPDSIHQVRVASRRLRSALRTFRPVLERERVRAVREELRWYAGVLGGARDAEVLRERLAAAARADAAWSPPRAEAAAQVAEQVLGARYAAAHDEVTAALDGQRYRAMVTALEALVEDPPLTEVAARPASAVLLRRARAAHRELADLVEAALDPALEPGEERDTAVHEARKAGKRARYAAEALAPVWPEAADYARAAKKVQSELGDHQDSVVAREALLVLADTPEGAGHAFALGRLHGLEQAAADRAESALVVLWQAAAAPALRRWMQG